MLTTTRFLTQAENFRALCTGEKGKTSDGTKDLCYRVSLLSCFFRCLSVNAGADDSAGGRRRKGAVAAVPALTGGTG
jgi:hypothetical protein